ncbi:hypothetical protein [Roseicitreum antarcticum]|uniref:hypothetical protein n=1 Tax=Roseicitreum antarcticum TaxID=564137 RepID=UPI0016806DF2|nr:hypothetical protein [Roseicitreum antarcticum]
MADDVRRSTAGTISNPAIASIRGEISLSWASGAIDITLDVSAPQLEIGVEATDVQITAADNFAVTQSGSRVLITSGLMASAICCELRPCLPEV